MVFKKYIKRGSKKYGPYLYENKKINGRVTTKYLGKGRKDFSKLKISLIFVLLFFAFSFFYLGFEKSVFLGYSVANESSFVGKSLDNLIEDSGDGNPKEEQMKNPEKEVSEDVNSSVEVSEDNGSRGNEAVDFQGEKVQNSSGDDSGILDSKEFNNSQNESFDDANKTKANFSEDFEESDDLREFGNESSENKSFEKDNNFNESTEVSLENINKTDNQTVKGVEENVSVETKQYGAVIGKPVRWVKHIKKTNKSDGVVQVEIPDRAENVSVKADEKAEESLKRFSEENISSSQKVREEVKKKFIEGKKKKSFEDKLGGFLEGVANLFVFLTGSVVDGGEVYGIDGKKKVNVSDFEEEAVVEYYTEAPVSEEEVFEGGKKITISGPDEFGYENILAYTEILGNVSFEEKEKIKLYWVGDDGVAKNKEVEREVYDLDEDGFVDYVEWVVPHLSVQEYKLVIEVSEAQHLDEDRNFVEDVYGFVSERDGNFTFVESGEYLRISFEDKLTSKRDITIYARSVNESASIEVYRKDGNELLARFEGIVSGESFEKYKVFLTNLSEGESLDTFDLLSVGNVEYDYVVDPEGLEISSCEDLQNMNNNLSGDYFLSSDIDCSDTINWNLGSGFEPIGSHANRFNGSFSGEGFKISNLYINRSDEDYVGLFSEIDGGNVNGVFLGFGHIHNVFLENVSVRGKQYTGGLVGNMRDGSLVEGVNVSGEVYSYNDMVGGLAGALTSSSISYSWSSANVVSNLEGSSADEYAGGLVGYVLGHSSEVYNSSSSGEVNGTSKTGGLIGGIVTDSCVVNKSFSSGRVFGGSSVGGLVGVSYGRVIQSFSFSDVNATKNYAGGLIGVSVSLIEDCYARGNVRGDWTAGGLVADNLGPINRSYSTGEVVCDTNVGGLIGRNNGSSVENSFWDTETSGQGVSVGGTGKTTSEMTSVETYTDLTTSGLDEAWDFFGNPNDDSSDREIWDISSENDGYPFHSDYTPGVPRLELDVLYPADFDGMVVEQDEFFDVTINLTCFDAFCGEVNTSLKHLDSEILVPEGLGDPFYTNITNPNSTNLDVNESVLVTWHLNATGDVGNYSFFVYSKINSQDISNTTSSWNVTINDSKKPLVWFESDTSEEGAQLEDWIYVDVSASDTNFNSTLVKLYNSTGGLIKSNLTEMTNYQVNYTGLDAGTYYLNATANDSYSNENSTETREILIVGMSVVSPLNDTAYFPGDIDFNVSSNYDFSECNFTLGFDGLTEDYLMDKINNTYFYYNLSLLDEGTYVADFWCNFSYNAEIKTASKQVTFYVDDLGPTLGTPTIYEGSSYSNTYYRGVLNISSEILQSISNVNYSSCSYLVGGEVWRSAEGEEAPVERCYIEDIDVQEDFSIKFKVANELGIYGESAFKSFIYDVYSPNTTINDTNSDWRMEDVSFNFSCLDNSTGIAGSGCNETFYKILDGDVDCDADETSYFVYNDEIAEATCEERDSCIYSVCYYSNDSLFNRENTQKQIFKIDKGLDVLIISPDENFYNYSNLLVNISSSSMNEDKIWYNWNGTNATYTDAVTIDFPEGENTLHAWANDSFGRISYSNFTFVVDTNSPELDIISPEELHYTNYSVLVNISANDDNLDKVWYGWEGENVTYDGSYPRVINFSGAVVTLHAWANDSAGNVNYANVTFDFPPVVNIVNPEAKNYLSLEQLVNISVEGVSLEDVWYNWNGTNVSYLSEINVEFDEGTNILHAWANDSFGRTGYSNVSFDVFLDDVEVSNCEELQDIENDLTRDYRLVGDIDCSDTVNWNSGRGFDPLGDSLGNSFEGNFNGQEYTISNLYINRSDEDYVGLFGYVKNNEISNLTLENFNISGESNVGGLVGRANNFSLVGINSNASVYGSDSYVGGVAGKLYQSSIVNSKSIVNIQSTSQQAGGLVGNLEDSFISESYSLGRINTTDIYAGGLVGYVASSGEINNSYSRVNVSSSSSNAGGLVGRNFGDIDKTYSTGSVSGTSSVGGLVGWNGGSVENSFWDNQTSGQTTSAGGTGKTTSEMTSVETYTDLATSGLDEAWDFDSIWNLYGFINDGYPILRGMDYEGLGEPAPELFIISPKALTYGDHEQVVNISATSDILESVWYNWNGTNATYNDAITIDFPEGEHTLYAWANDSDGRLSYKNVTFTINLSWVGISNCQELQNISLDLTRFYYLENDVDCSDTVNWNLGEGFDPLGFGTGASSFSGIFEGRNYSISNLYINRPTEDYVGLFGYASDSSLSGLLISDVSLVDFNITADRYVGCLGGRINDGVVTGVGCNSSISSAGYAGGLVGVVDNVNISHSYSDSNLDSSSSFNGGLFGRVYDAKIEFCYSLGSLTSSSYYNGGMIGYFDSGNINNSYSRVNVSSSSSNAGGLVGRNYGGSLYNTYSTGSVSGTSSVGGLVGWNGGSVENSFWDNETSGQATSAAGTGKTTSEMKAISTFTDISTAGLDEAWDFDSIWNLYGFINDGYPILRGIDYENLGEPSPTLILVSPENTNYNHSNILVNVSSNGNKIWYNWNGTNVTYTTPHEIVFDEGWNTIDVWANDSFGRKNSTRAVFLVDTIDPSIDIISPENVVYYTNDFLVNISASDDHLDFVKYNFGGFNYTYDSPLNKTLSDGVYTMTAYAIDSAGNIVSDSVSFEINTTPPELEIISPEETDYDFSSILINISANSPDLVIDKVWYNWNGTNATYTDAVTIDFPEGTHTLHAWANDSAGRINYKNVTFEVGIKPSIRIDSPANISYGSLSQEIRISASEEGMSPIDKVWYNWNGTNATYTDAVTIDFPEGTHTLHAWANTTLGKVNYTNVTFTIDLTPSGVYIHSPENTTYLSEKVLVNISSGSVDDSITYQVDEGDAEAYSEEFNYTFEEGTHVVHAWSYDSVGNSNYTNVTFEVVLAPRIEIISPNEDFYSDSNILINISVNGSYLEDIWYNWNGTNVTYIDELFDDFEQGNNTIQVWANNSYGLVGYENFTFEVELPPEITINSPIDDYIYDIYEIPVNISVNSTKPVDLWYNWNGTNYTYVDVLNITFDAGWNTIQVWANSSSGLTDYAYSHFYTPEFDDGNGSREDPYQISLCRQLQSINPRNSDFYILTQDINCTETLTWNSGAGFRPIGGVGKDFKGNLGGRGYDVFDVYINRSTENYGGLFGRVAVEGVVHNFTLSNLSVSGGDYVGGVCGWSEGNVSSVVVNNGSVGGGEYVGGAVGYNTGRVNLTSSMANVTGTSNSIGGLVGGNEGYLFAVFSYGVVEGNEIVGGLVGGNYPGGIINSTYSRSSVAGNKRVGGLIGYNSESKVYHSYSTGNVTGESILGGLVGQEDASVLDENNYWDNVTSGLGESDMGLERITNNMTYEYTDDTFVDWDFDLIWEHDSSYLYNDGYPILRGFNYDADIDGGASLIMPFGLYEPLCCAGNLSGDDCVTFYNEATGEGDLYCSDSSEAENYISHIIKVNFTDIEISSSDVLGCYITQSNGTPLDFNVSGISVAGNYVLEHVLDRDDEIVETESGINIPWYLHNCSIKNSGGAIRQNWTINRRVYVHESRPWTDSDLTLAVGCETNPNRLFNNSARCSREGEAIASSKEFGFAFKRYAQSGVEAYCYDGSPEGNDPTLADGDDSTCQTWWDNYTTPDYFSGYDENTPGGITSFGFSFAESSYLDSFFILAQGAFTPATNIDSVSLLSGSQTVSFHYPRFSQTNSGGKFKTRIRTAASRFDKQYNFVIDNLPSEANSFSIIGNGLPSDTSKYIVSLDDTGGKKTLGITCSSSACETSQPVDIVVEVGFSSLVSEANRDLTYQVAWTSGDSESKEVSVDFGLGGLTNIDEKESDGTIGLSSCADDVNNDLDISTDYDYINSLSPFNRIDWSRDCAEDDCHLETGPSYTAEQDIVFSQGSCEYRTELSCDDGYDNDYNDNYLTDAYGMQGIFYTDCHDIDCFQNDVECPSSEMICDDGVNNDWDYVDTEAESPSGHKIGNTNNDFLGGESWNGLKYHHSERTSNLVDCEDPDCDLEVGGSGGELCEWSKELTCDDGFNNDVLQVKDCEEDGVDYGVIGNSAPAYGHLEYDCADYCKTNVDSVESGSECDDGKDNDWDYWVNTGIFSGTANTTGGIDCGWNGSGRSYNPDTSCHLETMGNSKRCELGTELTCDDSFDNDYDSGFTTSAGWSESFYNDYFSQFGMTYGDNADCDDYDCYNKSNCPTVENLNVSWCFDGADNDLDGPIDCADEDCLGEVNPSPGENGLSDVLMCAPYEMNSTLLMDDNASTWSPNFCGNIIDDESNPDEDNTANTTEFGFSWAAITHNSIRDSLSNVNGVSVMDCGDDDCYRKFGQCAPCASNEFVEWDSCFDNQDNDHDNLVDELDDDCSEKVMNDRGYNLTNYPSSETEDSGSCVNQYNDDVLAGGFYSTPVLECADSDCFGESYSPDGRVCEEYGAGLESGNCFDDFDNDGDGLRDCYDSECYVDCGVDAFNGEGVIYAPLNQSQTIVAGKISLTYPVRIRKGNDFVVKITYLQAQSSSDTSDVTIGSQGNPIPNSVFNVAGGSSCVGCSSAGLTFDTSQAASDNLLMVKKSSGGSVSAGTSVYVVVDSRNLVLNPTSVDYSAQFSGTPGQYTKDVEVLNSVAPSMSSDIFMEPDNGKLSVGEQLQVVGQGFSGVSGGQVHSGRPGYCKIELSGPLTAQVSQTDCGYAWSLYASGDYAVTITPYDSTGLEGASVGPSTRTISVAPKINSQLERGDDKRVHFSSNESYDSFADVFNGYDGIMTAQFRTDTNNPYDSGSCQANFFDSSGTLLGSKSIGGSLSSGGSIIECSVDSEIDYGDGMYFVSVSASDGQGHTLETKRETFFVCNDLNSSGSGWNCSQADFDVDGYAEGIYQPFNYGNGVSLYNMTCDSCLGITNTGRDTDGDGIDDACDPDSTECGNGLLEFGEGCDDGNLIDGDGCSSSCILEENETVVTPTGPGGGGSGDEAVVEEPECYTDDDCSSDKTCYLGECVKLFDVVILNASAPRECGGNFDFEYFLKGMADFQSDVILNYWIEKDGEMLSEGQDVVYLGSFEEMVREAELFLPGDFNGGFYRFHVKASFENYGAESFRDIQIDNFCYDELEYPSCQRLFDFLWILLLIGIVFVWVYYKKKNKNKRRKNGKK